MQAAAGGCASKKLRIAGWVVSVLPALFLIMGAVMNIAEVPMAVDGAAKMGYSTDVVRPIGVVLLVSTLLYLIPATGGLGAILLTGYLGGAVATHVIHGDPLFARILMPVYFGVVLWAGLVMRDPSARGVMVCRGACFGPGECCKK